MANAKIYVLSIQFFLCFILNLRAIYEYKSQWACIWRGNLSDGFLSYEFEGGEGYIWRGLFLEFYGLLERNLIVVAWLSLTKSKSL